jgi:preprotein translocase subunit SecA
MSLYTSWTDTVVNYVKHKGEAAFWKEYGALETNVYTDILGNYKTPLKGSVKELAEKYATTPEFFMGFVDGINDSLKTNLDLENLDADQEIVFDVDLEKLYFNMVDAKADYLYNLPQWNAILSDEKRKEITAEWRKSKVIVNEVKVGRNDACPCGSGKKYKKCCGLNK